jgi:hypothetical protein
MTVELVTPDDLEILNSEDEEGNKKKDEITIAIGLNLDRKLTWEEYQALGLKIKGLSIVTPWLIGDFLNFGERRFGSKYATAEGWFDHLSYSRLTKYKMVASRFPPYRRNRHLSMSHHEEVVRLPPTLADKLLLRAEKGDGSSVWSCKKLRQSRRMVVDILGLTGDEEKVERMLDSARKVTINVCGEPGTLARLLREEIDRMIGDLPEDGDVFIYFSGEALVMGKNKESD